MAPRFVLAALALSLGATTAAEALTATFSWAGIPACSSASPAFKISGAPNATARLRFQMIDQDAPNFRHGGATIPYAAKGIVPKGAISYVGPCPPKGEKHRYVWTIEALDAAGKVLAATRVQGMYPP